MLPATAHLFRLFAQDETHSFCNPEFGVLCIQRARQGDIACFLGARFVNGTMA
ncbi:hypothetical protein KC19_11G022500 [Ceratodon purpureus]|uniref:Uncharacterized protein n=1 Tax=Ceratodon purpureus TaxID=3225 RepID=A0A8T0GDA5_CERPU|nr:hypothetical protein KC19_11G022500 [Ceratodon purpureus]